MRSRNRRWFLGAAASLAAASGAAARAWHGSSAGEPHRAALVPEAPQDLVEETARRTCLYFWETIDPVHGLAPDYTQGPDNRHSPAMSIAATGFALSALPIGVARGWIARPQAVQRALASLQFLRDAPQGDAAIGTSGHHGFFYHFLHADSGTRFRDSELSTIDTALLMMGVRCIGQYFNQPTQDEQHLRALADEVSERVEWPWMQAHGKAICMGWRPETGFLSADWIGFNEAIPMMLLALGSGTHPVGPEAWAAWTSGYDRSFGEVEGITQLSFGALFAHQFTQAWVDMRGIRDAYMAARGFDYFENTRRVALAHKAYAIRNPMGWQGYGADLWGLSASDGPGYGTLPYAGGPREFRGYSARGVGLVENFDDGTICPAASIGCLPHTPEASLECMQAMYHRYGSALWGPYGFYDCFNPSYRYGDIPFASGHLVDGLGWVDDRYYGINQGPIVALLDNAHHGLLWSLSRADPVLVRGLKRAGFHGGWLD